MSLNRNKVLNKAQKYVQQGKLAKAITEYERLVADDPNDVRTLLKMGDLYAKMGNVEAALETYRSVAEHYAKDGFFLKAVAVYKQMLKLDPSSIHIYTRLAELYHQLGLSNEAMKQYQIVAKHYETKGMKKDSLDIFKKMAELDPDNIASRVKLAELYAREGHSDQALKDFLNIAAELKEKGNKEDLIKVYEKIVKLDPENIDRVRDLATLYLDVSEPKRALAKLQLCFKYDPKNEKTLALLAKSFDILQQPEKTKAVYMELLAVYEEKGMKEKAEAIRESLVGHPSAVSEVVEVSSFSVPIPESNESDVVSSNVDASSEHPVEESSVSGPPGVVESEAEKLISDVDVYLRYGLADKATQALTQFLEKHPTQKAVRDKLADIYVSNGDQVRAAKALMKICDVARSKGDDRLEEAIVAEVLAFAPDHAAALERQQELQAGSQQTAQPALEEAVVVEEAVEVAEEDPIEDLEAAVAEDSVEPAGSNSNDDEVALMDIEAEMVRQPDSVDVEAAVDSQIDFKDSVEIEQELALDIDDTLEGDASESEEMHFSVEPVESVSEPAVAEATQVVQQSELEMELPADAFVDALDIDAAAGELDTSEPEAAPAGDDPFAEGMDEARFFLQQGLTEEAADILTDILKRAPDYVPAQELLAGIRPASPAEPEAEVAAEEFSFSDQMEREPQAAESSNDFFDLAVELSEEIQAINTASTSSEEEEPPTFDEVFAAFKQGVKETLSEEDSDAHYDLGIAYKEMGLLDDAIREFQIAAKNARLRVDAFSGMGLCFSASARFDDAEKCFINVIDSLEESDERMLGVKYELAEIYARAGKLKEALETFKSVYKLNRSFRNVSHRIKALAEQVEGAVSSEDAEVDEASLRLVENADNHKKSKISFL